MNVETGVVNVPKARPDAPTERIPNHHQAAVGLPPDRVPPPLESPEWLFEQLERGIGQRLPRASKWGEVKNPPPSGDFARNLKRADQAYEAYNLALAGSVGREVGIFYNLATEEFAVTIGAPEWTTLPKGDKSSAIGQLWVGLLHYHPKTYLGDSRDHLPSGKDIDIIAKYARKFGRPWRGFVESNLPDSHGGGRRRTEISVNPLVPDNQVSVRLQAADGTRETLTFNDARDFYRYWQLAAWDVNEFLNPRADAKPKAVAPNAPGEPIGDYVVHGTTDSLKGRALNKGRVLLRTISEIRHKDGRPLQTDDVVDFLNKLIADARNAGADFLRIDGNATAGYDVPALDKKLKKYGGAAFKTDEKNVVIVIPLTGTKPAGGTSNAAAPAGTEPPEESGGSDATENPARVVPRSGASQPATTAPSSGVSSAQPRQSILVVGAETADEFSYARTVARPGTDVVVANPLVTEEAKAFQRAGGNFFPGTIEALPETARFDLIREDYPFPIPEFWAAKDFVTARLSRLNSNGFWIIVTESPKFVKTLERVGKELKASVEVRALAPEAAPVSSYPKESGRYVVRFTRPQIASSQASRPRLPGLPVPKTHAKSISAEPAGSSRKPHVPEDPSGVGNRQEPAEIPAKARPQPTAPVESLDWLFQKLEGGGDHTPLPSLRSAVLPLRVGEFQAGITRADVAFQAFREARILAPGREVGPWYNPETGEWCVVVGTNDKLPPPERPGPWINPLHNHPNQFHSLVHRLPAPVDVSRLIVDVAIAQRSLHSFIEWDAPGGGHGYTQYTVEKPPPGIFKFPVRVQYINPDGTASPPLEFENENAYTKFWTGEEETFVGRDTPDAASMKEDMRKHNLQAVKARKTSGSNPGSGRTNVPDPQASGSGAQAVVPAPSAARPNFDPSRGVVSQEVSGFIDPEKSQPTAVAPTVAAPAAAPPKKGGTSVSTAPKVVVEDPAMLERARIKLRDTLRDLLHAEKMGVITTEKVQIGLVRITKSDDGVLTVSYTTIHNLTIDPKTNVAEIPGRGLLIHQELEQAARDIGREVQARSARLEVYAVQNPNLARDLKKLGYKPIGGTAESENLARELSLAQSHAAEPATPPAEAGKGPPPLDVGLTWRTYPRNGTKPIVDQRAVSSSEREEYCGPACAAMLLQELGWHPNIEALAKDLGDGMTASDLAAALRAHGLPAAYVASPTVGDFERALQGGRTPAIALVREPDTAGLHWVVVDGFTTRPEFGPGTFVAIRDPWGGSQYFVSRADFARRLAGGEMVLTNPPARTSSPNAPTVVAVDGEIPAMGDFVMPFPGRGPARGPVPPGSADSPKVPKRRWFGPDEPYETAHPENPELREFIGAFLYEGVVDYAGQRSGRIPPDKYERQRAFYLMLRKALDSSSGDRALHGDVAQFQADLLRMFKTNTGVEAFLSTLRRIGPNAENPEALDEAVAMIEAAPGRSATRLIPSPSKAPEPNSGRVAIEKAGPFLFWVARSQKPELRVLTVKSVLRSGLPLGKQDLPAFLDALITQAKSDGVVILEVVPEFIETPDLRLLQELAADFGGTVNTSGSIPRMNFHLRPAGPFR